MIKISKDYLYIFSRVIPIIALIIHLWIIFVCIMINFWPVYLAYAFVASIQFFFAKIWRYFLLNDVYINSQFNKVLFKTLKSVEIEFNREQISKQTTYFGITDIVINDNGNKLKFYFMVNSKENLKYLSS
jgi:hypothetical protein